MSEVLQYIKTSHSHPAENSNHLFPVFLKLEEMNVLLVGAGKVGLEKLTALLKNSPHSNIRIVAAEVIDEVKQLVSSHPAIVLEKRYFEENDLEERDIVIIAVNDIDTAKEIRQLAKQRKLLVNVADTPELCDFYLGSIVQKGNLKIAISTNGKSPTAAKRIREVLQHALPDELDELISNLHLVRKKLNGNFDQKVKTLNRLTATLVESDSSYNAYKWKRIARFSVFAFAFMLIGYFIFSYLPMQQMANATYTWYKTLDSAFPVMLLAGFLAQLVDGALGMGYGVTSATILLSAGVNPAAISGSIHTAEMFASGASGYSHYKFGNVNKKLFRALIIPGVLGAVAGAVLLVMAGNKYGDYIRPVIAAYTLVLGIKFIMNAFKETRQTKKFKHYRSLAAVGGFFDSFGGGGWGPIVTSTLINNGRSHKYAVGTVSLTEFFVTLASAFTFFTLIGVSHWQTILALVIGGLAAAPLAARLAGKLPKRTAYLLLGVLVIIWSIRILVKLI